MRATDSMRTVPTPRSPRDPNNLTTREAVAVVVEYLVGDVEKKKVEVIAGSRNLSESTFYRILRGGTVGNQKLWSLAKSLGVPTATFTLMVDGDVEGIRQLVALDIDTKQYIVNVLERSLLIRNRRDTDS